MGTPIFGHMDGDKSKRNIALFHRFSHLPKLFELKYSNAKFDVCTYWQKNVIFLKSLDLCFSLLSNQSAVQEVSQWTSLFLLQTRRVSSLSFVDWHYSYWRCVVRKQEEADSSLSDSHSVPERYTELPLPIPAESVYSLTNWFDKWDTK